MTLPNFLIIGAAKAGTTSLYNYLRRHPQVFMSPKKELHFFPLEFNWHRGLAWYEQHFADASDAVAVGEASTTYTRYPYSRGVPRRIAEVLPEARMVYVVRHPIERMRSQYQQHIAHGWERERSVDRALLENPFYLDTSRYATQIDQYLECFPRERMMVITSEDLRDEREATVRRVYAFLGVDPGWVPSALKQEYNTTRRVQRPAGRRIRNLPGMRAVAAVTPRSFKRVWVRAWSKPIAPTDVKISDEVRRELEDRLKDEVRRLRRFLGDDFTGWDIA